MNEIIKGKVPILHIPSEQTEKLLGRDDVDLKVFLTDLIDNDDLKFIREKFEGSVLWEKRNSLCVMIEKDG